jgi:hypothetical protein
MKTIGSYSMETNTRMWLRRLVILGTPLVLAFIELWHPRFPQQVFQILSHRIDLWLGIHLLQLPLFGLLALAVYLLVKDLQGVAASVSRVAMWFFVVFYTAFDAVVGIATGILIRNTQNLSPERQAIAAQIVEEFFYNPIVGDISVISVLGSLGWIVGVIAAAIALTLVGCEPARDILSRFPGFEPPATEPETTAQSPAVG